RADARDLAGDPGGRAGIPQPAVLNYRRDRGRDLRVLEREPGVEDRRALPHRGGAERRCRIRGHEHLGAGQCAHSGSGPQRRESLRTTRATPRSSRTTSATTSATAPAWLPTSSRPTASLLWPSCFWVACCTTATSSTSCIR